MERISIDGGEHWVGFARSRIQALLLAGLGYARQSYYMPDGAEVMVGISDDAHTINIKLAAEDVVIAYPGNRPVEVDEDRVGPNQTNPFTIITGNIVSGVDENKNPTHETSAFGYNGYNDTYIKRTPPQSTGGVLDSEDWYDRGYVSNLMSTRFGSSISELRSASGGIRSDSPMRSYLYVDGGLEKTIRLPASGFNGYVSSYGYIGVDSNVSWGTPPSAWGGLYGPYNQDYGWGAAGAKLRRCHLINLSDLAVLADESENVTWGINNQQNAILWSNVTDSPPSYLDTAVWDDGIKDFKFTHTTFLGPGYVVDYSPNSRESLRMSGDVKIIIRVAGKTDIEDKGRTVYREIETEKIQFSVAKGRAFAHTVNWYSSEQAVFTESVNSRDSMPAYREAHPHTRITVSRERIAFVLSETSTLRAEKTVVVVDYRSNVPGSRSNREQATSTYGWQLEIISLVDAETRKTKIVSDTALGASGYILGVIVGKRSKKFYIYYGVGNHDIGFRQSDGNPGLIIDGTVEGPRKYTEYLVEYSLDPKTFEAVREREINLGEVDLFKDRGIEHRGNSKLCGAAVEVRGYIWAEYYVYDIKKGVFYELPDQGLPHFYHEPDPDDSYFHRDTSFKNTADSPYYNNIGYALVSFLGKKATYLYRDSGVVARYAIVSKEDGSGETLKVISSLDSSPGWTPTESYSYTETDDTTAFSAVLGKTKSKKQL